MTDIEGGRRLPGTSCSTSRRSARPAAAEVLALIDRLGVEELQARQAAAASDILTMGITFTVYSDGTGIDRAWPFDVIPRVIEAREWAARRARAWCSACGPSTTFIDDVYNDRRIVADGVFPAELLDDSANYRPECRGRAPEVRRVGAHLRVRPRPRRRRHDVRARGQPARAVRRQLRASRTGPSPSRRSPRSSPARRIAPVDAYTDELNKLLASLAPGRRRATRRSPCSRRASSTRPTSSTRSSPSGWAPRSSRAATSSSATTTACTCARSTGSSRSTSSTAASTTCSSTPRCSAPTRRSACPGLMRAWKAGKVGHRQRAGRRRGRRQGRVRLGARHHPLLPRRGAAARRTCRRTAACTTTSAASCSTTCASSCSSRPTRAAATASSSATAATDAQLEAQVEAIEADPRNWVAQPILELSTAPTLCGDAVEPRHVDLRPFILTGATSYVTAGGLTRVALPKGSLVVNSSQGGGSKDTWIVDLGAGWGERLTCCCRGSPTGSTGRRATSSGPRTRPGSCGPTAS